MRKIAIANQKGGVGKTPLSVMLSVGLAMAGRRVLLIDMDPQGNATDAVLGVNIELDKTTYDLLMHNHISVSDVVRTTYQELMHIVPSDIELSGAEVELITAIGGQTRLASKLNKNVNSYDYIIFDTPPNLGMLTINTLAAANEVLVPISPSVKALKGISQLENTIERVKQHLDKPDLRIAGAVCTRYKRDNVSRDIVEIVRERFGDLTFKTVLRESVKFEEADSRGESIFTYAPSNNAAKDAVSFVQEVISNE